jgi:hypothetical protein
MRTLTFGLILVCLSLSSCDDNVVTTPPGSIAGFVTLYDEFGGLIEDGSGVGVAVSRGTTTKSTETISGGSFSIGELPAGSYDITFDKENFGISKMYGLQLAGGENPMYVNHVYLHEKTTTNILIFDVSLNEEFEGAGYRVVLTTALDPFATRRRSFIVFVDHTNAVSDKHYLFYKTMSINHASGLMDEPLFDNEWLSQFASGTELYFIAYPVSTGDEGYFETNGLRYFPSVGEPTESIKIVVP